MEHLVIHGGRELHGTIPISGSKNAALPILFAALLFDSSVTFHNVPRLKDIRTTCKLLEILGCETHLEGDVLQVVPGALAHEAPYDLVKTMRASALCLGPLLARLGRARVALPGGCAIGARPVDMHLAALEKMGATFELDSGYIDGRVDGGLKGAHIQFPFPTVGGTENLLMAAALAEGETILENAAREPEVTDLANFLNACGARITGQGTSVLRIQGVARLVPTPYAIMSDRIEAGTYMAAVAATRGDVLLTNCPLDAMDAQMDVLQQMGVQFTREAGGIRVRVDARLRAVDVMTLPYPGFPTDMQAQVMAAMCLAEGSGVIEETIFENRFMHVQELMRMGARIKLSGRTAVVRGVERLNGAPVMASDLRASASLVVAGLAASGVTTVQRIYHLDRGYEELDIKLTNVGAKVYRSMD
ncbi:UDP-N-acetylglucosamine 1-carboxyvinyltransferase [Megalodesulfovibrio gigas]|uniref:UDP-N-acetylglucosamine 1-carboxyvinyltransferase n=1 Tax=Megalodesulfovibrio gigas (strain ATCC 19364 / DSM 1382 / NCIMB 9332 / VKM B-1759) TaxID=1121448 RepID=T2G8X1_MEGG1|nr:UDP-N-acetylglucosamine 1-carboxyvinyltransferase [Megalodesulfovibrio gigas]AGW12362.1 putative UDP-N-acetylglucosamine 1-carboxyvinyltransferase [Megalodesulfovibrio gigas DSM 1382 = ATCC 19364]